jgi:hypothetical protein
LLPRIEAWVFGEHEAVGKLSSAKNARNAGTRDDVSKFAVFVVAAALIQTLDSLDLKYPEVGPDKLKELAAARAALVK